MTFRSSVKILSYLRNEPRLQYFFVCIFLFFTAVSFVICSASAVRRGLKHAEFYVRGMVIITPEKHLKNVRSVFLKGTPDSFVSSLTEGLAVHIKEKVNVEPCVITLAHSAPASCCDAGNLLIAAFGGKCAFAMKMAGISGAQPRQLKTDELLAGCNINRKEGMPLVLYGKRFTVKAKFKPTGLGFFDNAVFMSYQSLRELSIQSLQRDDVNNLFIPENAVSFYLLPSGLSGIKRLCSSTLLADAGLRCFFPSNELRMLSEKLQVVGFMAFYFPLAAVIFCALFTGFLLIILTITAHPMLIQNALWGAAPRESGKDALLLFLISAGIPAVAGTFVGSYISLLFSRYFTGMLGIPYLESRMVTVVAVILSTGYALIAAAIFAIMTYFRIRKDILLERIYL